MRKYRPFLLALLVILTLYMGCITTITKKSESTVTDPSINIYRISSVKELNDSKNIYINNQFKFSVEYPVKWRVKEEEYFEATIDHNPSPDGGINIFVEGKPEEKIYVFGQVGPFNINGQGFKRESFVTNSGLKGALLSNEEDGKKEIYLAFYDVYIGAALRISVGCFNQNKEQIMDILKSIKPI